MLHYHKLLIFILSLLVLSSCTVYTEKQSREISRTVYATKESLDKARIDLAVNYSEQATRLIKPPKPSDKITIESIYKTTIPVIATSSAPSSKTPQSINNKQRVVIVPEIYKHDSVVVVNSEEYQQLLKDKQIFDQIKKDFETLKTVKEQVDEELSRQQQYYDKMVQDLNRMQKQLLEKDLAILKRNVTIAILILIGAAGVYLRMKGIL